jgi:hypothetical protein
MDLILSLLFCVPCLQPTYAETPDERADRISDALDRAEDRREHHERLREAREARLALLWKCQASDKDGWSYTAYDDSRKIVCKLAVRKCAERSWSPQSCRQATGAYK